MTEETEINTYLTISKNKFGIYLLDKKKMNTLYKEELNFDDKESDLEIKNLSNFLDKNIFKVEKLLGKFVNNIFVVIDDDKILNINMSLKRKNYDQGRNLKTLESLLIEAKDLLKKNNNDHKIMHMVIKKYIINGESYLNFVSDLETDSICVEVNFICIPIELSSEINLILDKYHIQINRFLDANYIYNLFLDKEVETEYKICKVLSGYNENEVNLVLKSSNKIGFFEKFFQLFS